MAAYLAVAIKTTVTIYRGWASLRVLGYRIHRLQSKGMQRVGHNLGTEQQHIWRLSQKLHICTYVGLGVCISIANPMHMNLSKPQVLVEEEDLTLSGPWGCRVQHGLATQQQPQFLSHPYKINISPTFYRLPQTMSQSIFI